MDRIETMNAAGLLIDAVTARPGTAATATAIHWVDRDRSLTYKEAVDAMARSAAALSGFGVPAGRLVGLFAHPGIDYVVALLGAWRLGATAVLVDLADKDRFHELMTAAAPHAVVYTNDHFDYVRPTVAALGSGDSPTVFAGMDGPQEGTVGWLDALSEATPLTDRPAADAATTATTTAARAIATTAPASTTARTHAELIEAASAVAARLDLTPGDATLCPTPLAQPFHLEASILPALMRGATAGLLKSWQPDDAWEAMDRNGTTVLCGTAEHCEQLLEASAARGRKPVSLRAAVTTAATATATATASATSAPATELADRLRTDLDIDLLVQPSLG